MNFKTLNKYINYSTLFAIVLGVIFHFLYKWSGGAKFVGYFTPVNESIWEHTKLSIFPLIIVTLFLYFKLGKNGHNLFLALSIATLVPLLIILTLFYLYVYFTKGPVFIFDILIFLISIIVPLRVIRIALIEPDVPIFMNWICIVVVIMILGCIFQYTYSPLDLNMFKPGEYTFSMLDI